MDETEHRFASWKYFDFSDRAGGADHGDLHGADGVQPDGHGVDRSTDRQASRWPVNIQNGYSKWILKYTNRTLCLSRVFRIRQDKGA